MSSTGFERGKISPYDYSVEKEKKIDLQKIKSNFFIKINKNYVA